MLPWTSDIMLFLRLHAYCRRHPKIHKGFRDACFGSRPDQHQPDSALQQQHCPSLSSLRIWGTPLFKEVFLPIYVFYWFWFRSINRDGEHKKAGEPTDLSVFCSKTRTADLTRAGGTSCLQWLCRGEKGAGWVQWWGLAIGGTLEQG